MKRSITTALVAVAVGAVSLAGTAQAAPSARAYDELPSQCHLIVEHSMFALGCYAMDFDVFVKAGGTCINEDGSSETMSTGWQFMQAGEQLSMEEHCAAGAHLVKVSGSSYRP